VAAAAGAGGRGPLRGVQPGDEWSVAELLDRRIADIAQKVSMGAYQGGGK